jgi:hypothetical protein
MGTSKPPDPAGARLFQALIRRRTAHGGTQKTRKSAPGFKKKAKNFWREALGGKG